MLPTVVTYVMLQGLLDGAVELFFPDNCLLCREYLNSRHQRQICPSCQASLAFNPMPYGRPVSRENCAFEQAWPVLIYNETGHKLLHAFKYGAKISLQKTFVPLMVEFIRRHRLPVGEFDCMTPIPLHPSKWRERGYNQSALLSLGLSGSLGVAHTETLLSRVKRTQSQTELGAKQRWTNLDGAFKIKNSTEAVGKNILLVDDLLTTGATAHYAAAALKAAGAVKVGLLTLFVAV